MSEQRFDHVKKKRCGAPKTHAQTALYAAAVVQVAKVLVTWKWFKVLVTAACNSDVQDTLAETALDVAA